MFWRRQIMKKRLDNIIKTDDYKIEKEIAQGTWGTVYEAKNILTGERVAIKVLTPNQLAQQQMDKRNLNALKAMKKEAGLVAARNVVPRMLLMDDNEKPFLVMPFYEKTLDDLLMRNNGKLYKKDTLEREADNTQTHDYMLNIA